MADKQPIIIKKKKIIAGHGHHGGAWKVAYADFVTAMMAFFLVMWLMGSDEETKTAIAHYFNHPNTPWKQGGDPNSDQANPMGEQEGSGASILPGAAGLWPQDLVDRPRPIRNVMSENVTLSKLIEELLDGKVYGMDVNPENIRFSLPESILFKAGSSELNAEAMADLDLLGRLLKTFNGFIVIEGHTDDSPIKGGAYASNWELSFARAMSVMNHFSKVHGIPESRMQPFGRGSRSPIAAPTEINARQKNRRVDFTLTYDQQPAK